MVLLFALWLFRTAWFLTMALTRLALIPNSLSLHEEFLQIPGLSQPAGINKELQFSVVPLWLDLLS